MPTIITSEEEETIVLCYSWEARQHLLTCKQLQIEPGRSGRKTSSSGHQHDGAVLDSSSTMKLNSLFARVTTCSLASIKCKCTLLHAVCGFFLMMCVDPAPRGFDQCGGAPEGVRQALDFCVRWEFVRHVCEPVRQA